MTKVGQKTKSSSGASQPSKTGKPRKQGQWKDNPSAQTSEKIGFAVVSVKLRPAEKAEFVELCKEVGVTPNYAMRSMTRQVSGFLEPDPSIFGELKDITKQISGVAKNINQIAKVGNRTLSPDYQAFMEDRKELGVELARLEQMMQQILNVGKRRVDGLRRLQYLVRTS